jgi:hypothetical protein
MPASPCGSDEPAGAGKISAAVRRSCRRSLTALAGLFAVAFPGWLRAEPGPPGEYQIKAAFLYNFAKFAVWPESPEMPSDSTTLCVFGDDPFGAALDEAVGGKSIHGKPVVIKRMNQPRDAVGCQVLFVAASESQRLPLLLRELRGLPVLTVGDMPQAAQRGAVIGFRTHGNRVRFEINPDAALQAGLRLSSQLLRLATLVSRAEGN